MANPPNAPLMPKATAVWLVDNTALSFQQIADFCKLHELEVKGIADGDVAQGIKGLDPVSGGQLTRDEIERGEKDPNHRMKLFESKVGIPVQKIHKGPRYTPVSRRQDRPDAIAWLLRYHAELSDSQIMKLVGTTKTTIESIRTRTHWNSANLKAVDPVTLGLCTQIELDFAVQKAARKGRGRGVGEPQVATGSTLLPASETIKPAEEATPAEEAANAFASLNEPVQKEEEPKYDADSVFAKLKGLNLENNEEG
jgi:hypothetical protein